MTGMALSPELRHRKKTSHSKLHQVPFWFRERAIKIKQTLRCDWLSEPITLDCQFFVRSNRKPTLREQLIYTSLVLGG